ncbi:MAG: hydrolase [Calditrichaeota bacterium]|nr:MAG: hydrolase [Calditrichota bacterium]
MKIAVDFDGTIVEHKYPEIGKPILFAFEALKELNRRGHKLILWTYRSGRELDEAVAFCREKGVEFYAVNKSHPDEVFDPEEMSRKIDAELFIDDRNLGGFPGWAAILHELHPEDFAVDTGASEGVLGRLKQAWREITRP